MNCIRLNQKGNWIPSHLGVLNIFNISIGLLPYLRSKVTMTLQIVLRTGGWNRCFDLPSMTVSTGGRVRFMRGSASKTCFRKQETWSGWPHSGLTMVTGTEHVTDCGASSNAFSQVIFSWSNRKNLVHLDRVLLTNKNLKYMLPLLIWFINRCFLPDAHTCVQRWLPSGSCGPWVRKFRPDEPRLKKNIFIEKHKLTKSSGKD